MPIIPAAFRPKLSPEEEESFSVIERLADAIRIEDDVRISAEDRQRLVQDLYEGPRKCQCCINWTNERPADIEVTPVAVEECLHPLIVRRAVMPGDGGRQLSIHSIEVCNAEARRALFEVFRGCDGIVPHVRYLVFKAPFRPFFWRWERFEKAVEEQPNEVVKAILVQLRSIVRAELAEAFAVSKELVSHGIITFKHLWTIFPPGAIVYDDDGESEYGRYYSVRSSKLSRNDQFHYQLSCVSVDWDGSSFGWRQSNHGVNHFIGTRAIQDLPIVPARYVKDGETIRQKCIERGRKFRELAGMQYKAYIPEDEDGDENPNEPNKALERRIMIDAKGYGSRKTMHLRGLWHNEDRKFFTGLILQAPVDTEPAGGHRPLPTDDDIRLGRVPVPRPGGPVWNPQNNHMTDDDDGWGRRPGPSGPARGWMGRPPPPPPPGRPPRRRSSSVSSSSSSSSDSDDDDGTPPKTVLTDLQLQLCSSRVSGYDLREKDWDHFDVARVRDIEWNSSPFDSLVLPEGYKDLILSFVENQLKDNDTFDDVINGKGGGLVILLAGDPGVGKTLTAESVAEKFNAPLVKMELAQLTKPDQCNNCRPRSPGGDVEDDNDDELSGTFKRAARWNAVLLIDECDMYLEKRKDDSPQHNRLVSRFLRELEYYPSLLFLTTNRERLLDPAIYSRIHLTINYPALDRESRLTIWKTFLARESDSQVSDEEFERLSYIDVNGRRIKNITKTARIMAKRLGRGICFADIKNVMRITEGLVVE